MLRVIQPKTISSRSSWKVFTWNKRFQNTGQISLKRKPLTLCECQCVSRLSTLNSGGSQQSSSRIKWFWIPTGVGFALISFLQFRHIRERERRKQGYLVAEKAIASWQVTLFKVLPTRALSRLWGSLHDFELPVFLRSPIIRLWVWSFECNLQEAQEEDVTKYLNLGQFFTRKLKPGARVIDHSSELVCPVDGKIIHFGHLINGELQQIKAVPYSLETFLGPQPSLAPNDEHTDKRLFYCVLYLGPGDCHHFHSPTNWTVDTRRHFPGELYSVAPWVLRGFKDVLCTNERVALFGNWKYGLFSMTAVGAYNVGSIQIHFDQELKTNRKAVKKGSYIEKVLSKEMLVPGDSVGCFSMGSAIVLVFEAPSKFKFTIQPNEKVKLGQGLGTVLAE